MPKYIDDNMQNGIEFDWKAIRKEFAKLKIPATVYNPLSVNLRQTTFNMLLGERSTGKTTNVVLLGMIVNKVHGTKIQYIRQSEDMTAPKIMSEMMATILEYGYIEKITDGRWNSAYYRANRWFYCKVDETGTIIEKDPAHFMFVYSLDRNLTYKSSINIYDGDFIILDEFIGKMYKDDFYYFMDLMKTIGRDRLSPIIFMISNTINKHSQWFAEMGIQKEINKLKPSQRILVTTPEGTDIFISWVENVNPIRNLVNSKLFGFDNPKLNAIKGGGWLSMPYQHIPPSSIEKFEVLDNSIYLLQYDSLVRLEIVSTDHFGVCVYCHKANKIYDDSVIFNRLDFKDFIDHFPNNNLSYANYMYGFGSNQLGKIIFTTLRNTNKWFYADGETFDIIQAYTEERNKLIIR